MIDRTFIAREESAHGADPTIGTVQGSISPALSSFLHFLAGLIAEEIINQTQKSEMEGVHDNENRITTLPE
jgi:hypothetical protein